MKLNVYVPAPGIDRLLHLADKSGIVGLPAGPGLEDRVRIYYEGNLYHASNLEAWAERVNSAAGRMAAKYPTTATLVVSQDALKQVGEVEYTRERGVAQLWLSDIEALREYIGDEAQVAERQIAERQAALDARRNFRNCRF